MRVMANLKLLVYCRIVGIYYATTSKVAKNKALSKRHSTVLNKQNIGWLNICMPPTIG